MGIEIWLAVAGLMLVSLSGVLFVQKTIRGVVENRLPFLVSFSAGVFLVTAGALTLEVFEQVSSVWMGVLLVVGGYLLATLGGFIMPEVHHHHDESCGESKSSAKKLMIGDALHNIGDGVVLVTAFTVSPILGVATAVSLAVHETLQEIAEFFVLRQAGYSTKQALLLNFSISSTVIIGVLIGYFALDIPNLEVVLLAVSAGFFLQVVVHDLLPKRAKYEEEKEFGLHVLLVLVGVLIMALVSTALGESHSHGGDVHDDERDEYLLEIETNHNQDH
ncbi:MAG: ZIP family metal transporter [Candidatus Paceibacterota bacterium]